MSLIPSLIVLFGALINVIAGIGLVRFDSPYARFHAAGKASPVGFLIVAIGVGIEMGGASALHLAVAAVGLVLTLPVGMHLLFRAVHRGPDGPTLAHDDLSVAEAEAAQRSA